ncbi:MAG: diaminopimelate epimerase [Fimbriimonadaceae bacterium]|nr:diaminopimelate epimerase [Fimbriimonadaceae bacterium]
MPEIPFRKFHGIGNDFVILDARDGAVTDRAAFARSICDRHRGVGSDGAIWIDRAPDGMLAMEIRNPDGSRSEMCGNGLRCFAIAARDAGDWPSPIQPVSTGAGVLTVSIKGDHVTVEMGLATLTHECVPTEFGPARGISMGNPHLVIPTDRLPDPGVYGPTLEHHPAFPDRTNVHWSVRESDGSVRMVTWERGAGRTLGCGTGACAVAYAAILDGAAAFGQAVTVHLPGGDLEITVLPDRTTVMRGPAIPVFDGVWPA